MTAVATAPRAVRLSGEADPLLSLRTVYGRGGPHPQTLRGYIHAGKIPAVKVGKQFMLRESDLKRLITPVPVDGTDVEVPDPAEAEFDDLAALAARMVSTWPRLSAERKAELGRLLAS